MWVGRGKGSFGHTKCVEGFLFTCCPHGFQMLPTHLRYFDIFNPKYCHKITFCGPPLLVNVVFECPPLPEQTSARFGDTSDIVDNNGQKTKQSRLANGSSARLFAQHQCCKCFIESIK